MSLVRIVRSGLSTALLVVSACSSSVPNHVDVPFRAGEMGATAEATFHVSSEYVYFFYLLLGFDENIPGDRDRVRKIAGDAARDRFGNIVDMGLKIPVHLELWKLNKYQTYSVFERDFDFYELESYNDDGFRKIITKYKLQPGTYRALVTSKQNVPEVKNVKIKFQVLIPGTK